MVVKLFPSALRSSAHFVVEECFVIRFVIVQLRSVGFMRGGMVDMCGVMPRAGSSRVCFSILFFSLCLELVKAAHSIFGFRCSAYSDPKFVCSFPPPTWPP